MSNIPRHGKQSFSIPQLIMLLYILYASIYQTFLYCFVFSCRIVSSTETHMLTSIYFFCLSTIKNNMQSQYLKINHFFLSLNNNSEGSNFRMEISLNVSCLDISTRKSNVCQRFSSSVHPHIYLSK